MVPAYVELLPLLSSIADLLRRTLDMRIEVTTCTRARSSDASSLCRRSSAHCTERATLAVRPDRRTGD